MATTIVRSAAPLIILSCFTAGCSHPAEDGFFNGRDLTGWSSTSRYWSVEDGAIVGRSTTDVPRNDFLWSDMEFGDFYLCVDVKLSPDDRNAGVQFRSRRVNDHGQARGYQADVGSAVWGKLYHEHGRGKLDWNDRGLEAVNRGHWNQYEILAVGHHIWLALNGELCVALNDPDGEVAGRVAFQIHSGLPQTVRYRVRRLVLDPPLKLGPLNEEQLMAALKDGPSAAPQGRQED